MLRLPGEPQLHGLVFPVVEAEAAGVEHVQKIEDGEVDGKVPQVGDQLLPGGDVQAAAAHAGQGVGAEGGDGDGGHVLPAQPLGGADDPGGLPGVGDEDEAAVRVAVAGLIVHAVAGGDDHRLADL